MRTRQNTIKKVELSAEDDEPITIIIDKQLETSYNPHGKNQI